MKPLLNIQAGNVDIISLQKTIDNLFIENQQLALQNEAIQHRMEALLATNKELTLQNLAKNKPGEAVLIANRSLHIAAQKVADANMEIEDFTHSVSHVLKAHLGAISRYTNILKEDFGMQLYSEANDVVNIIVNIAAKMSQLIDDLYTFSHLCTTSLNQTDVDMKAIVQNVIKEIASRQNISNFLITIQDIPTCTGDAQMLRQVWYNLVDNAIRFMGKKQNPEIEIGGHERGKEMVYYIKDNGVGFNMKYANKLFQVFQRLHPKDEFEGTGLGLSQVKKIVQKHDGRVFAESAVMVGTRITFIIPIVHAGQET